MLSRQDRHRLRLAAHQLRVDVVDSSEVAAVVLDPAQRGPADLTGRVDSVDGFVLGQTSLVPKLFPAHFAGENVPAFLQWVHIVEVLPET